MSLPIWYIKRKITIQRHIPLNLWNYIIRNFCSASSLPGGIQGPRMKGSQKSSLVVFKTCFCTWARKQNPDWQNVKRGYPEAGLRAKYAWVASPYFLQLSAQSCGAPDTYCQNTLLPSALHFPVWNKPQWSGDVFLLFFLSLKTRKWQTWNSATSYITWQTVLGTEWALDNMLVRNVGLSHR